VRTLFEPLEVECGVRCDVGVAGVDGLLVGSPGLRPGFPTPSRKPIRFRNAHEKLIKALRLHDSTQIVAASGSASGTLLTVRSGPKWLVHPFGRDAG